MLRRTGVASDLDVEGMKVMPVGGVRMVVAGQEEFGGTGPEMSRGKLDGSTDKSVNLASELQHRGGG